MGKYGGTLARTTPHRCRPAGWPATTAACCCVRAFATSPASSACRRSPAAEYDTVIIGGPARACSGGLRGLRPAHARDRARSARVRRKPVADRELSQLSVGVSGENWRGVHCGRPVAWAANHGHSQCGRHRSSGHGRGARWGEPVRARSIIVATGVSWRRLATEGFDRLLGKNCTTVPRAAKRALRGAGHPSHRRWQLGGQGGDILCQPRAHGLAHRPWRHPRNQHVALPRSNRSATSQTSGRVAQRGARGAW